MPQSVTDHEGAEGPLGWTSMPAVEVMPVQARKSCTAGAACLSIELLSVRRWLGWAMIGGTSIPDLLHDPANRESVQPFLRLQSAILTPEAGSVFAAATTNSIKVESRVDCT